MSPWIILGGFGAKYSLVHFRRPYLEVDLSHILRNKSDIRCDWMRRGVAIAFTENAIPAALFVRFEDVNFLVENEACDFEP